LPRGLPATVVSGIVLAAMAVYSAASDGSLDRSITSAINLATRGHRLLDHFFLALDEGPFLSGSILVGLVWYCWFQYPMVHERARLMVGTLTALGCGLASRLFQLLLPSHLRPLHDPLLAFQLPAGVEPSKLSGWSSFPSDHATVFAGLAYILYRSNPKAGLIAAAAAILFDFARIYLGYHYTSDVIGGTALGVLGLELVDGHREEMRLQVAASSVGGGKEVDHHRPLLERIGELERKRLAGKVGGRGEIGRLRALLQCGDRRRGEGGGGDERERERGELGRRFHAWVPCAERPG
jgi:undecaprenyl-diphosphatase